MHQKSYSDKKAAALFLEPHNGTLCEFPWEKRGSLSEIYNLFTSIHRLSTCLFFHINLLHHANSCFIHFTQPAYLLSLTFHFTIFRMSFFLQNIKMKSMRLVKFICFSCVPSKSLFSPSFGLNLRHKHHTHDQKRKDAANWN